MPNQERENSQSAWLEYAQIPPGYIRLITLFHGKGDEPVTGCIDVLSLEHVENGTPTHTYNALSYTWGSDERTFPIILNDKTILVTENLGNLFLVGRGLLAENDKAHWWVDQLCINQDDDEDKAQQVPLMKSIYETAYQVVPYLSGLTDPQLAVDLISRLHNLTERPENGRYLENVPLEQILGPSSEHDHQSWRALAGLMNHRYWSRTWILPEVTANLERNVFCCNTMSIFASTSLLFWMRNVIRTFQLRNLSPDHPAYIVSSSPVGRAENFHNLRSVSKHAEVPLFEWLDRTRRSECTRLEDKIFSVLPLAADVGDYMNNPHLKPKYTGDCEDTYTDLIKWYVLKYKNLNFLGACSSGRDDIIQVPGFDLPSWVPNWTHAMLQRPIPKYRKPLAPVEELAPLYRACGPFSHSIEIVEPPSDSAEHPMRKLFVSGLRIATIHKVLEATEDEGKVVPPDLEMSWENEIDGTARYALTGEFYHDAFNRTLVMDLNIKMAGYEYCRPGRMDQLPGGELGFDCLKIATRDRRLFFARSEAAAPDVMDAAYSGGDGLPRLGTDCHRYLMGLGRSDIAVGDEIWALKGGQVLYVLRKYHMMHRLPDSDNKWSDENFRLAVKDANITVQNLADSPEPGWPHCPSLFWLNGKSYPWNEKITRQPFRFAGECYVHGLMDGEALDFASKEAKDRPESLEEMADDFEEIFIGGFTGSSVTIPKDLPDHEVQEIIRQFRDGEADIEALAKKGVEANMKSEFY